jgi:hypothetical protein
MTNPSIASNGMPLSEVNFLRKLVLAFGLAAFGDWLFYGQAVGISIVLFLVFIDVAAVLANPHRTTRRETLYAAIVLLIAILPLLIELNFISFLFGVTGASFFALVAAGKAGATWIERIRDSIRLILHCGWQAFPDSLRAGEWWLRGERTVLRAKSLYVWIVPLALGAIFLLLFAAANPLIEGWFAAIDVKAQFARVSFVRIAFWLLMISLVWPFIFVRGRNKIAATAEQSASPSTDQSVSTRFDRLLGSGAILRALVLFNLLFAVQTALDLTYLWGGLALPDGMTYAAYAHRGAYPLIATALLAAAFVIIAMKPGSEAERSPLIRALIFLWIGQNVLLVGSSILRLNLYVEAYSLTYWRLAAFVWMLLVALGLVLISVRIMLGRSNSWLVSTNLAALVLTLYISCFVNIPHFIATYNVQHSRELSGDGASLDTNYLIALGPQAIPALDVYIVRRQEESPIIWTFPPYDARGRLNLVDQRNMLANAYLLRQADWRAFSYRDWQLVRYLENKRAEDRRSF